MEERTAGGAVLERGLDETVSDATLHTLDELEEGDVIVGGADPMPYVIAGSERRPVQSVAAFLDAGYEPSAVKVVHDPKLEEMPIGDPIAAAGAIKGFDSANVFLGSGHYMRTWGTLNDGSGQIAAQTRIWTITWFGGYHGASHVIFTDENDAPVHQTQVRRYGVDGTWVGRSDYTGAWWENMGSQNAVRVRRIYIFHAWAPDSFQTILNKWVAAGKSVAELAGSVASVAKVVAMAF